MGAPEVVVRQAEMADARTIATVRVQTWRAAYAGLIPVDVLDALDIDRETAGRERGWAAMHADPRARNLLAEVDGVPVGWASVGPVRDSLLDDRGELYALYVLSPHWGSGVGHALLGEAEAALRAAGFTEACLWYLAGNERAARFYERHGWREDGGRKLDDRLVGGAHAHTLDERRRVKRL